MEGTLLRGDNRGMDVVGPDRSTVPAARQIVDDVILPLAERIDEIGVPRSSIDALAAAGFLGTPLPAAEQREVGELIAMADASTWFCWVQHQSPLRALEGSANEPLRDQWLAGLRSGAMLGGVAFAHIRRPGPPNPVATRITGGYRIDGTLDWVTSWDIADVVMVMAQVADSPTLVSFMIPGGRSTAPRPGLRIGEPLRLLAMSGTHTRPLAFDGYVVADELVVGLEDAAEWHARDAIRTKDASPGAFGVVRGAIAELVSLDRAELAPVIDAVATECRVVRRRAYSLADAADEANGPERLTLRAQALDLVVRAATAVVVARSGSSMMRGTSSERRVREAMFLQVQAQTAESRVAGLELLSAGR